MQRRDGASTAAPAEAFELLKHTARLSSRYEAVVATCGVLWLMRCLIVGKSAIVVNNTTAFNAVAPKAYCALYRGMPPTLAQRFGRAVRQFREAAGYSQERFAAAAKIDRAYYSRIERGHVNVSLEIIQRIVKTLRINYGELFHAVDTE